MSYGRIDFHGNADALDRQPRLAQEKRTDHLSPAPAADPVRDGQVCPECNIRRTPREFFCDLERVYVNCKSCRGRGKSMEARKR